MRLAHSLLFASEMMTCSVDASEADDDFADRAVRVEALASLATSKNTNYGRPRVLDEGESREEQGCAGRENVQGKQ